MLKALLFTFTGVSARPRLLLSSSFLSANESVTIRISVCLYIYPVADIPWLACSCRKKSKHSSKNAVPVIGLSHEQLSKRKSTRRRSKSISSTGILTGLVSAAVQAKIDRWSKSTSAAETFQHADRFSQSELSLYANITEYYDILTTGLVPHGNSNSQDGKVRGKLCTRHLS